MNQPIVPLFLPRQGSDHSQLEEWPWVPFRRATLTTVRRRHRAPTSEGPVEPSASATSTASPDSSPVDVAPGSNAVTASALVDADVVDGSTASHDERSRSRAVWAVVITGLALFMASLDNLVVSTALPVIRVHLHAGLSGLEWTVNAYTLTFAVLLLTAAALGERFGRRRIFVTGIALFTASSAAAALAPSIGVLIAARALQGAGGAMIMPLSLTLLSAAVRPERRNAALGIWGAIGGTAIAIGPLVGGAVTSGWAWQYIFWLNVPVGIVLVPLARWRLAESRGSAAPLDLAGVGLVSAGLFGVVFGLVRGNAHGWTSGSVLASFALGILLLVGFVTWEMHSDHPMLDLRLFARRGFTAVNLTALLFSFGMFGAIFFLTQFLQTVQHYSPLDAGIRILPWTAITMVLAPFVGQLAERWGGKPLVVTGLGLQAVGLAWLASILSPTTAYGDMVVPFVLCGVGMTLFFVPLASVVLGTVPTSLEGVASGANAAFRELGGVLGIAALGAVFSSRGGYASAQDYVSGLVPAVAVGAGVVAVGAVVALALPSRRKLRLDIGADDLTPLVTHTVSV
jgi:EmrB/QacA subfamily drug resistance transporter